MKEVLRILENFPKDSNGLCLVYELYTFDNLVRLLLKQGLTNDEALSFVLCNSSVSAYVFQERIHNRGYRKLHASDALPIELAACKARLIHDLSEPLGRKKHRRPRK